VDYDLGVVVFLALLTSMEMQNRFHNDRPRHSVFERWFAGLAGLTLYRVMLESVLDGC